MKEILPVTADSIARAKAAQQRERFEVFHKTGITVTDDGTAIVPPARPRKREVVACGLCNFTVFASTYDAATQTVCDHIVRAHMVHPFTAESLEQAS